MQIREKAVSSVPRNVAVYDLEKGRDVDLNVDGWNKARLVAENDTRTRFVFAEGAGGGGNNIFFLNLETLTAESKRADPAVISRYATLNCDGHFSPDGQSIVVGPPSMGMSLLRMW